ncbi:MAG TPA: sigma-70 family RNA polymerase sigma factor, partial [Flavisolibacter sp.]|nr:sigma-70 family RNA polymerase sigma factor [Flavisolibacter sp.]
IAENLVYDFFRRAARDIRLRNELLKYSDEEYLHIEEQMNRKEHAALLQSVIDELPFQRRQVFQLVKQDQRSYAEVSRLLDISPSTISDHIVKATKFIRSKLSSHHIISLIVFMLHK